MTENQRPTAGTQQTSQQQQQQQQQQPQQQQPQQQSQQQESGSPQEKPTHQHYLSEFRVDACPLFKQHQCQQHRPFTCFKWHFANQRRRKPVRKSDGTFNYSPDIYCDKYDENTGICPDGDNCVYLHRVSGDVERKYHLRYYKTAQCVHPTDGRGQCVKNGAHCAFAHTCTDLRQPMHDQQHESGFSTVIDGENRDKTSFVIEDPQWHSQDHVLSCYKTEQCRKPARLCRQGYACPFYHNSKDRRRPPAVYKYRSTPCPAAKTIDEWLDPDICEAGDNCQYCHTRTEQQFHPEIYKSTKCNDMLEHGYCPRAVFCAFAHHDSELHAPRNPYVGSTQASPKEQCSPSLASTNGFAVNISTEQLRYETPVNNGIAPSYSAVLKQRQQPIPTGKVFASPEMISSSYPKAPGFERNPLGYDPMRSDQFGRLRTSSLNMGQLDMMRRTLILNGGLSTIDGGSLVSQSSLCRSDSGFNVVTDTSLGTLDELSLDLPPIEEANNRSFTHLFGEMPSPMRIPQQDPFGNPSLFSQGDQMNSPVHTNDIFSNNYESNIFQSDSQNGDFEEMSKMQNMNDKLNPYEETLKQAKHTIELWKMRCDQFEKRCEHLELHRNRACYERDHALQQLEALKIQLGYSPQINSMSSPLAINATNPDNMMDGCIRPSASLQHSPPYNIFGNDCDAAAPACARCGRDRSRSGSDSQSSCPLCSST